MRQPIPGFFSLERLFQYVRDYLPEDIHASVFVNRRRSKGMLPRVLDALAARRASGQVNHVLGDVHYIAWFLPPARTLVTVLDCIPLERTRGLRRWLFWLLWYWWPLKRAAYVAVISEFTRRSLLKWVTYPQDRVVVIPPAVSEDFVYTVPRPHGEWRRILQIGSTENKNVSRLVQALAGLDVTLIMIGKTEESVKSVLEQFEVRYECHANVDDAGLVSHYRDCDLLAFPSTYEGWGMPIIEAQATGRPVVTSNVASMPEAAGGSACLVDPFDVGSIRAGILRVLNDEAYALALIDTGRLNAQKYRPREIANRYADLYRKISALAEMNGDRP